MATVAGEFVWKYTGDVSGHKTAVKNVQQGNEETEDSFDKVEKSIINMGNALKVGLVAAAAIGFSKLKQFFGDSVQIASDAQETAQKFGNVYDEITEKANRTAAQLAKNYNVTNTAAKEMLGSTGNVLQAFGFSQDAALDYSRQLAELGSDLTSFTNYAGGAQEATRILTKALLGERDALQALDLKITDDQLRNIAKSHGLVYKNLTQRQKAELTMNELMRQSSKAMGDVAKSSNSYAFVTRALENRTKDLKEQVGGQFLPALTDLKKAFVDSSNDGGFLYNALMAIGTAISKVLQGITVLTRAFDYLNGIGQDAAEQQKILKEEFKRSNVSFSEYAKVYIKNGGDITKTALALKKSGEEGNLAHTRMYNALMRAGERLNDVSKTGKAQSAYNKLNEAVGKFTGTLKDSEKAGVKGFNNVSNSANQAASGIGKAKKKGEEFLKLDFEGKLGAIDSAFSGVAGNLQSLLGAIDSLYGAIADKENERLEADRQRALEAAGVAEETALEKAQRELAVAKEKGDKDVIQQKEIEVKRAKINEEFDKKKAELDYNANLRSWELQLAMAKIQMLQAPLNAYVSSLSAPWPLNMILAPLNAALALATATVQHAAIAQAKPQKPKFQEGGIVPGNTTGDNVDIRANGGEMMLTKEDQTSLLNFIRGGGANSMMIHNRIELDGNVIYDSINEAARDGRVRIPERSIIRT